VEDHLQIQGDPFQMDSHAFRVDECPNDLHVVEGQHLAALQLLENFILGSNGTHKIL